jgi:hypothetical protein
VTKMFSSRAKNLARQSDCSVSRLDILMIRARSAKSPRARSKNEQQEFLVRVISPLTLTRIEADQFLTLREQGPQPGARLASILTANPLIYLSFSLTVPSSLGNGRGIARQKPTKD